MNDNNQLKTITSYLPLVLLGVASVFVLQQYLSGGKEVEKNIPHETQMEHAPKQQEQQPQQTQPATPVVQTLADFEYPNFAKQDTAVAIETERYVVLFSREGGRITKFYLKSSGDLKIPDGVITARDDLLGKEKRALEITIGNGMEFQPHLYAWGEKGEQLSEPSLNKANFQIEGPFHDPQTGNQEIRFTLPITFKGHKLELIKVYRFLKDEYYFHQITVIRNLEEKRFVLGGRLFFKPFGSIGPKVEERDTAGQSTTGRFYYYDGSLNEIHYSLVEGGGCSNSFSCSSQQQGPYTVLEGVPDSLSFLGSRSRYFLNYAKFISSSNNLDKPDGVVLKNITDPEGKESVSAIFKDFQLDANQKLNIDLGNVSGDIDASGKLAGAGNGNASHLDRSQIRTDALIINTLVYAGLRSDDTHNFFDKGIAATEFGSSEPDKHARDTIYSSSFLSFFSVIRDFIIWLMRVVYNWVGNYGWAIIIIAGGIKLATFPLNQVQAKSMKKMQALKPEIDAINEKYAKNPNEKQKKTMELYKKHNINPAKGCFPMLIQIPIFIALYSAFSDAVELWSSPFIWWMQDLSKPDTVYVIKDLFIVKNLAINILPIVMLVSQVGQQFMTQMAVDKQQKMLMYIMPFMMLFFFWNIPSGVTLYWTIQNFIAIVWQFVINHIETREKRAA